MKLKNGMLKSFVTKDITENFKNINPWLLEKFIIFKYFLYNLFSSKYAKKRTFIPMGEYWFLTVEEPIIEIIKNKKILIGYKSKLIFFNNVLYYKRLLYLGLHPIRISLNGFTYNVNYVTYQCEYFFKSEKKEKSYKEIQKKLKKLKGTKTLQIIFLDSFKIGVDKRSSIPIITSLGYRMESKCLKNFYLYDNSHIVEAYYNNEGNLDEAPEDTESYELTYLNPFTNTSLDYYTKAWFVNGTLHRNNKPAFINEEEHKYYYNGLLHRLDGPAIINKDNFEKNRYYRNGKDITNTENEIYIKLKQTETLKNFKNKYSKQIKNLRVKLRFN
jgi:hypothetical protein